MNFISFLWAFIPSKAKIPIILVGCLLVFASVFVTYFKIEQSGYDRCTADHAKAEQELKEKVEPGLANLEKTYDKIKEKIVYKEVVGNCVGGRVQHAIDSMPNPSGG